MAQSLLTLIFTGLLLLAQTLGIQTGTERKTVDDLISAFHDLRAVVPGGTRGEERRRERGNRARKPRSTGRPRGR